MTLSSHFNSNAKTECGIKVGVRKKSDGSTIQVRAGKIMTRFWPDGAKDKYGAEVIESKLRQQALDAKERLRQQAQAAQSQKPGPRAP
jgi:hypothetical protein